MRSIEFLDELQETKFEKCLFQRDASKGSIGDLLGSYLHGCEVKDCVEIGNRRKLQTCLEDEGNLLG